MSIANHNNTILRMMMRQITTHRLFCSVCIRMRFYEWEYDYHFTLSSSLWCLSGHRIILYYHRQDDLQCSNETEKLIFGMTRPWIKGRSQNAMRVCTTTNDENVFFFFSGCRLIIACVICSRYCVFCFEHWIIMDRQQLRRWHFESTDTTIIWQFENTFECVLTSKFNWSCRQYWTHTKRCSDLVDFSPPVEFRVATLANVKCRRHQQHRKSCRQLSRNWTNSRRFRWARVGTTLDFSLNHIHQSE